MTGRSDDIGNGSALTKQVAAPFLAMVRQFFSAHGIPTRAIYRTCSEAFGDSLGGDCPGNLVPKRPVSGRVTVFVDFNARDIQLDNPRRLIAFPESVAAELPRLPRWRSEVDKIDLATLLSPYVFRDEADLQTHYRRIFNA